MRQQTLQPYLEGNCQKAIGSILQTSHQSVANWIKANTVKHPPQKCQSTQVAVLDDLFNIVGNNKNKVYATCTTTSKAWRVGLVFLSRYLEALAGAIHLFVFCYNQRLLKSLAPPNIVTISQCSCVLFFSHSPQNK